MTEKSKANRAWQFSLMTLALFSIACLSGCGAMSQLLYVVKGHQSPAMYDGLNEKTVAVVCVSDQAAYGRDTLTHTVAKYLNVQLSMGLKEAKIVSPGKIEAWLDENGWDEGNVEAMGQGIGAEMLVVVKIADYSIHDGATLFKGKADVEVDVYDIEKGAEMVFTNGPEYFEFPENGRPAIQTSERRFEAFYLTRLADKLSNLFLAHDEMESFAHDAILDKS